MYVSIITHERETEMRGRPVGFTGPKRLVSFRMTDQEIAQLEELAFLIANRNHADGLLNFKESKTAAVTIAVATLLVQFKRALEESRMYRHGDGRQPVALLPVKEEGKKNRASRKPKR